MRRNRYAITRDPADWEEPPICEFCDEELEIEDDIEVDEDGSYYRTGSASSFCTKRQCPGPNGANPSDE